MKRNISNIVNKMIHLRKLFPLILLTGFLLAYLPPQLAADTENRAALVVNLGNGNVETACVSFSEDQITGYELLVRSGLNVEVDVQGAGAMVCRIDGAGCPADNCMCHCSGGGDCMYWSYWHQLSGNWQYSQAGASMYPVTNGMVDGWSWGLGAVNEASPPPNFAFDDVCQVPATATAVPLTSTPIPTNTPIPVPTLAPEISFSVDANSINAGACTTLRWQTANISAIYLNGGGVIGEEVREICPAKTETYTLKVLHAAGEETRSVTVNVIENAVTSTATPIPPTIEVSTDAVATVAPVANHNSVTNTPVAVAVVMQESVAQVAVEAESAVETPPTTIATPEINWIVLAPLPTETEMPIAEEIAAVPSPLQSESDGELVVNQAKMVGRAEQGNEETAVSWSAYIGFLVIVLGLGLFIIDTSQKKAARRT